MFTLTQMVSNRANARVAHIEQFYADCRPPAPQLNETESTYPQIGFVPHTSIPKPPPQLAALKQPILFLQIPQRGADIRHRESNPELVFIAQPNQIEPVELQADAAAIGVVGDLLRSVLHHCLAVIVDHFPGGVPPAMVGIAETGPQANLVSRDGERRVGVNLIVAGRNEILVPAVVQRMAAVHYAVPPGVVVDRK